MDDDDDELEDEEELDDPFVPTHPWEFDDPLAPDDKDFDGIADDEEEEEDDEGYGY